MVNGRADRQVYKYNFPDEEVIENKERSYECALNNSPQVLSECCGCLHIITSLVDIFEYMLKL